MRSPALQAQVEKINNETIPALKQEIQDKLDGKVDKVDFEAYKTATAATIALMQQAIQNLADTKLDKTEFVTNVAEILAKFDDYVLKTTFETFKAIVGTEDELKNFEGTIIGRLKACEALLAGEWGDKTVQEYIDAKDKALQDQLDKIVNELIPALDKRVKDLEKSVNEVILPQLKFALNYEGGLQGYIDDKDAETLAAAKAYTDTEVQKVRDELNAFKSQMYDLLHQLASRIQSIVYVPDYDDLKITSNMAKTTVPGVEGALYIDQPTAITYKILPAEYAAAVVDLAKASEFKDLLFFDVKTVNTRADEEPAVEPAFQIIAAEKDANIDENGLVTFTVLPVNVASAAFAATAIPVEFNAVFGNVANVFGFDVPYLWADGEYVYPVVKEEDLEAYLARTAFAASLRFVCQDIDIPTDPASEEYNEILDVAPTTILIPNDAELKNAVFEAIGADKDPVTSNNAFNYQYGRWTVIIWPYLNQFLASGAKPWALLDPVYNENYGGAPWNDRVPLTVSSKIDDNTDANIWRGRSRFNATGNDWRYIAVGGITGGTDLS